ncbi:MAG TPA: hypothetical protein VEN81_03190 [Planctomycetota bacterium]|nr:hypothetical protein [Planctomycetota bacterium]
MRKLVLVRAPGLSPEEAVRGDQAWNVSDLIADGSFAPISGVPDVAAAVGALPPDRVTLVELPFKDSPSFDRELGKVREGAPGAAIAIVSDSVFISQHFFKEIKPGQTVAAGDLGRLLLAMLQ